MRLVSLPACPAAAADPTRSRQRPLLIDTWPHRALAATNTTMHCLPALSRVEGYFSASLDLSNMLDVTGEKLTWATLFGPNCPYMHEGAIHVTAKLAVVP